MTHYFWYSMGQEATTVGMYGCYIISLGFKYKGECNRVLINGEWVKYTECGESKKPFGNWDDYVLVGKFKQKEFPWERVKIDGIRQGRKINMGAIRHQDLRANGSTRLDAVLRVWEIGKES